MALGGFRGPQGEPAPSHRPTSRAQPRHHGPVDADDLYGGERDGFVAGRAALARALRAEGRRDEAGAVARLRKPSVAAWAVNRLVRAEPAAFDELLAAGDALRACQEGLLAGGGDRQALRAAGERERAAVDALVEAARGALAAGSGEPSPAVLERVAETLHAAALDVGAREQVRTGRLERELRHVGFGLGEGAGAQAPAPPPAPGPDGRAERERAEAARQAEREREAARAEARSAELVARRRAESAARAMQAAQERRDRAATALDEAEAALAEARSRRDGAAADHERARAELDRL